MRLATLTLPFAGLFTLLLLAPSDAAETKTVKAKDLSLQVPADWEQEKPKSKFRAAQFSIPAAEGDKEPAELVIFTFGGAAGNVAANVKRWVGQFAAEGREAKILSGKSDDYDTYVLVDVTGTYNKPIGPPFARKSKPTPGSRMLAAIVNLKDKGVYYLKLTGPEKTVTQAADAFRQSYGGAAKTEKPLEN